MTPNSKTSKAAKEEPAAVTPPENKTSASKAAAVPAAESSAPEVENVTFDAVAAEEPADGDDDVSDVVDTIKNGNNVVAFFCKYSIGIIFFSFAFLVNYEHFNLVMGKNY